MAARQVRRDRQRRDPRHHQRPRGSVPGAAARNLGQRAARWQIALGHGHYEPPETWHNPLRPSWLISDAMIAATGADYLALGHWDRAAQVGGGTVPAYYSGSPDYVHTVNLVRLTASGEVLVSREDVLSCV